MNDLISGLTSIIEFVENMPENHEFDFGVIDRCVLGTYVAEFWDVDWYYDIEEGLKLLKSAFGIDIYNKYDLNDDLDHYTPPFFKDVRNAFSDEQNMVLDLFRENAPENIFNIDGSIVLAQDWLSHAYDVLTKLKEIQ